MVKESISNVKSRKHEYILYTHDKFIQMVYVKETEITKYAYSCWITLYALYTK